MVWKNETTLKIAKSGHQAKGIYDLGLRIKNAKKHAKNALIIAYLLSTPQARSHQQTEILIHFLWKLASVNDICGMLYFVDPLWIFPSRIWKELQFNGSCACANKIRQQQYLWTWCQSVVPNDAPRDFSPEVAFGAKLQIPVARKGGREMSAPRPYVTEPFHPLSSINNW